MLFIKEGGRVTSEERREARYRRRYIRRTEKKARLVKSCDDFGNVFSYKHLYHSYRMCRRGVAWKSSVQKYVTQAPLNVFQTRVKLYDNKFKTEGFFEFDIMERGKKRHIKSVTMHERVVQRCLCDYALVPMLSRTFIYDNGASLKDKGYAFSADRLTTHLQKYYRKHGNEGYILLFDFSKFFDRVSHKIIKGILKKEFTDVQLIRLTEHFIDAFGDIGMGLGSQISQIFALASANRLDHYIKEVCHIKYYGRYMDDGYLIHHDKTYLERCLKDIRSLCDVLEIKLNEKKTQIVKLSRGFIYLKMRYFLISSGKVVKKICKRSVTRMRHKLKAFAKMVDNGIMQLSDVIQSFQSWRSYAGKMNAYRTIQNMTELYYSLFGKGVIKGA